MKTSILLALSSGAQLTNEVVLSLINSGSTYGESTFLFGPGITLDEQQKNFAKGFHNLWRAFIMGVRNDPAAYNPEDEETITISERLTHLQTMLLSMVSAIKAAELLHISGENGDNREAILELLQMRRTSFCADSFDDGVAFNQVVKDKNLPTLENFYIDIIEGRLPGVVSKLSADDREY